MYENYSRGTRLFNPTHQLEYSSSDVTIFCCHCVEYIKLHHTCAKFHDHWSNNNKVMIGGA